MMDSSMMCCNLLGTGAPSVAWAARARRVALLTGVI